jgi:hypothetical protein
MESTDEDVVDVPNLVIHIDSWSHTGVAKIRVSSQFEDELRADLVPTGTRPSRVYEFSLGSELAILGVSVGSSAAAWKAIASVIVTFIRRHDGKKITIDGVTIEGYGLQDAERIATLAAAGHEQGEQRWKQVTSRDEPPDSLG